MMMGLAALDALLMRASSQHNPRLSKARGL